ncbi:MAG: hypothetical protein R3F34_02395 [Planctomycetota bacterium]
MQLEPGPSFTVAVADPAGVLANRTVTARIDLADTTASVVRWRQAWSSAFARATSVSAGVLARGLALPRGTCRVVLVTKDGRVLAEAEVANTRPRNAVVLEVAPLDDPHVFVDLSLPGGYDAADVTVACSRGGDGSIEVAREGDGPTRFELDLGPGLDVLYADEDELLRPRTRWNDVTAPVVRFTHPVLGTVGVEIARGRTEYAAELRESSELVVEFRGESSRLYTQRAVVLGRIADGSLALDRDLTAVERGGRGDGRRVVRELERARIHVDGLPDAVWNLTIALPSEAGTSTPFVLASRTVDVTGGETAVVVVETPRAHAVDLWNPRVPSGERGSLRGSGLVVPFAWDADGRAVLEGVPAGRYAYFAGADEQRATETPLQLVVPCDQVLWVDRPHDALRVEIFDQASPLALAGLRDGDLVVGFGGALIFEQSTFGDARRGEIDFDVVGPSWSTAVESWARVAEERVSLTVERDGTLVRLDVGPIPVAAPADLEALGGRVTPCYWR